MSVVVIGFLDINKTATKADVTKTREEGRFGSHVFSVPFMITRDQASDLQSELGYNACGYGLFDFEATPTKTTWKCSHSCD